MKMLTQSIICTLAVLGLSLAANAAPIDERQQNQRARIAQGVSSGELTRAETKGLAANQRHIARTERRMKADGEFTLKERTRLQHKQNKASKRIYRQKHDKASRK